LSIGWFPVLFVQFEPMQNVSGLPGRSGFGGIMLTDPVVPYASVCVVSPPSLMVLAWMVCVCVVHWNFVLVFPAVYWSVPGLSVCFAWVLSVVVCCGVSICVSAV